MSSRDSAHVTFDSGSGTGDGRLLGAALAGVGAIVLILMGVLALTPLPSGVSGAPPGSAASVPPENRTSALPSAPSGSSVIKAFSLRVAQERLQQGMAGPDVMNLGGITRVDGFVVDKDGHDVILFGPASSGPALNLDDFVVALRNGWDGSSQPYCSIDPRADTIRRIQRLRLHPTDPDSASAREQAAFFKSIGEEPQDVRVGGIDRNTNFAKVIVDADYLLKRVSNGSLSLGVQGLPSVSGLAEQHAMDSIKRGELAAMPVRMSRFWFTPGEVSLQSTGRVVTLNRCQVRLLTQQQHLQKGGGLADTGAEEPFAAEFSRQFTRLFDKIAAARSEYGQLHAVFRFVALAGACIHSDAFAAAGLSTDYFRSQHRISEVQVPRTLSGITELKQKTIPQSPTSTIYYWQMSVGGVDISMRINDNNFVFLPPGPAMKAMDNFGERVKKSRPRLSELHWVVPLEKEARRPVVMAKGISARNGRSAVVVRTPPGRQSTRHG
jgi:hypothetical protein